MRKFWNSNNIPYFTCNNDHEREKISLYSWMPPYINFYKFSHMQTPRALMIFSNLTTSKALVIMSPNCFSVAKCLRFINLSSTSSLMKWWQMLICLVRPCWTRFFEILIVLKLSQYNVMTSCSTLYFFNIYFIHKNWVLLIPPTMYSTSAEERETQLCFLLKQEINMLPKKKHPPNVIFLSSTLPT